MPIIPGNAPPRRKWIGIVGSRRRNTANDNVALLAVLDHKTKGIYRKGDSIVSGGCPKGADNMAEVLCRVRGIPILIEYPRKEDLDMELLKVSSRSAYTQILHARNTRIAERCDVLIALVSSDRKGGTEDTVRKAIALGKKVIYV